MYRVWNLSAKELVDRIYVSSLCSFLQFDIHSPNTTVGEALWISSRLRFNTDVSDQTVRAFVEEVSPSLFLHAKP